MIVRRFLLALLALAAAASLARADDGEGAAPPIDARITVRNPDGTPSAGARIALGKESYDAKGEHEVTATADARGAALLREVRPGAYPLRAIAADGSAVTLTTVILDADLGSPEVRLEWPGTLEVAAAGDDGESLLVPDGIEAQRDDDLEPLVGKCDVGGGAPLVRLSLPAGPYHLAIGRECRTLIRDDGSPEWDVVVPASGTARVEVRVKPLGLVRGVVRAEGKPVAGAVVGVEFQGPLGCAGKALVTADAEGRYRAAAIGRATLRAFPVEDLPGAEAVVEVARGAPLERDFELCPASDLLVRALTAEGTPVDDATAWLFATGAGGPARSQSLRAGKALFPSVPAGRFTVVVAGRARSVTVTGHPDEQGGPEEASVVLEGKAPPPETGMLFVTLPPDTVPEGALFTIGADDPTGWRAAEQTSKDGVARLRLPPGEYTLSRLGANPLRDRGLQRLAPLAVTVAAGETTAVELPLVARARMRVLVRGDELGAGERSAEVTVRQVAESGAVVPLGVVTAERSRFREGRLPEDARLVSDWFYVPAPGEFDIAVALPGLRPRAQRGHVEEGDVEVSVKLKRPGKPCTIRFSGAVALEADVTDPATGLDLPHRLLPEDPEERRSTGIASITLEAGPAHLEVRVEGDPKDERRALADVILGEGSETVVELPTLGRSTLAVFVVAPPPRSGDLPAVRLEGPCGRLPKEMPGRVVWDRLPAGEYHVFLGEKEVAKATLAEGETRDLGVVGGR